MTLWQEILANETKRRWAACLIKSMIDWYTDYVHGEVDCFLTQFLSGRKISFEKII